ncbi:MAG: NAD(P)H-hydrate dehydratase [Peptoniphilaceae bacterium]|nr:NAD(P)H-hydrate dehydratase [Peptoniphilaceae bacterium]MDY3738262.1 NAD(P)H-hydrate dehydratase [Peptoniphilaceae bacterium]
MIGNDIVSINKIKSVLDKNPKFLNRIFTNDEINYINKKTNKIQTIAGMFAAKEAIVKALKLNIRDILKKNIEIRHEYSSPEGFYKGQKIEVSISHQGDYAIATAFSNIELKRQNNMNFKIEKRNRNTHKGDYGKVLIIAGSNGMTGAAFLSSTAALRSGVGLCYLDVPKSISKILQIKTTEVIVEEIDCENFTFSQKVLDSIKKNIQKADSIAIGPGIGKGNEIYKLLYEIAKNFRGSILIDADAINAIKNTEIFKLNKNIVLTPHEMEFSRISGMDINFIKNNREEAVKIFLKKNDVTIVLKGNKTIVANKNEIYFNSSGNPGMATAGSGDVLTGIISAFLARKINPFESSKLGVFIHGLAGDIAKEKYGEEGMIATDILDNIPFAIKMIKEE